MTEERAVEQLKSDFVSTVSHELRTPLAAIYGAALTLQRDDVRLEESQRDGLLDVISSEADRLARIVNDILWASRLDSGQMGDRDRELRRGERSRPGGRRAARARAGRRRARRRAPSGSCRRSRPTRTSCARS